MENTYFLAEFLLAELGVTPLPPLTENHPAQKNLSVKGGYPFPPLVVFDGLPYQNQI